MLIITLYLCFLASTCAEEGRKSMCIHACVSLLEFWIVCVTAESFVPLCLAWSRSRWSLWRYSCHAVCVNLSHLPSSVMRGHWSASNRIERLFGPSISVDSRRGQDGLAGRKGGVLMIRYAKASIVKVSNLSLREWPIIEPSKTGRLSADSDN